MLGQGEQQYGAMIGDSEISGFVGFDMFFFFFLLVFLVLLRMGILVFEFFLCNFFFSDLKISQ